MKVQRLVLPDGTLYTPTPTQWATLRLLATETRLGQPLDTFLPRDVWPDGLRTRQAATHRRMVLVLADHGVLERTPQGYRLPPSVRTQILAPP